MIFEKLALSNFYFTIHTLNEHFVNANLLHFYFIFQLFLSVLVAVALAESEPEAESDPYYGYGGYGRGYGGYRGYGGRGYGRGYYGRKKRDAESNAVAEPESDGKSIKD